MESIVIFLALYLVIGVAWFAICEANGTIWIEAGQLPKRNIRITCMVLWPAVIGWLLYSGPSRRAER